MEGSSKTSENMLFNMFHSRTIDKMKENILQSIQIEENCLCVFIAKNAVGIGFQCYNVFNLAHPQSLMIIFNKLER